MYVQQYFRIGPLQIFHVWVVLGKEQLPVENTNKQVLGEKKLWRWWSNNNKNHHNHDDNGDDDDDDDDDDDPANVSVKKKPHPVIATTANPAQEY